ncbi:MAG: hypothetical protein OEY92_05570 [Elusimicrobiota bacterium]|nr:hypothetical protein [Elusimicrobiota bacterium]
MVKKISFLLVILPLIFLSYGVASTQEVLDTDTSPGKESGEGLPEVVIKGEAKDTVKVEKAPYQMEIKLEEIVTPSIEETESLMEGGLDILRQEDLQQFTRLNSNQVIKPSLPPLPEPPLVTFHPRRSNLKIKKWKLTISDEKGSNIRTLQGKGSPPRAIEWDGRDERGKVIRVGTLYSYGFVAMDQDGRPHTTGGKPFQLWALKYDDRDSVNIEIANRVLYTAEKDEFSEDGKLIMDKAIDFLRQYSRYPFRIEICTDKQDFSVWEKAKALLANYISGNMILLPEDLRINVRRTDGRGLTTCFIIQTR